MERDRRTPADVRLAQIFRCRDPGQRHRSRLAIKGASFISSSLAVSSTVKPAVLAITAYPFFKASRLRQQPPPPSLHRAPHTSKDVLRRLRLRHPRRRLYARAREDQEHRRVRLRRPGCPSQTHRREAQREEQCLLRRRAARQPRLPGRARRPRTQRPRRPRGNRAHVHHDQARWRAKRIRKCVLRCPVFDRRFHRHPSAIATLFLEVAKRVLEKTHRDVSLLTPNSLTP